MNKREKMQRKEDGFVLIAALLILLVLTVMGIAVNRNTTTEWQIAMNDRLHKDTFYLADAATELASEVLEQDFACWYGLGEKLAGYSPGKDENTLFGGHVYVEDYSDVTASGDKSLWTNQSADIPSDTDRDLVYPAVFDASGDFDETATNSQPHANINIGGLNETSRGVALQQAAGYEGIGKGLGGGGVVYEYDIKVEQVGRNNSTAFICIRYGHALQTEGECNY